MGHILQHVLSKVHTALRNSGELLIIQPASRSAIVLLEVDGQICLEEELPEPNFHANLETIDIAIRNSIQSSQFAMVAEAICPDNDMVFVTEYNSIADYDEDHRTFCMDIEYFDLLVSKMKRMAKSRAHKVQEHLQEHRLLLRKSS